MLSVLLHRKRKAVEKALADSKSAIGGAKDAIELTQKVYGVRLPLALKIGKLFGLCVEKIFTLEE